jgi:hypothetical protein
MVVQEIVPHSYSVRIFFASSVADPAVASSKEIDPIAPLIESF